MGQIITEIADLLTVRFRFKPRNYVSEKVKIIMNTPEKITIYLIKIVLHQLELLTYSFSGAEAIFFFCALSKWRVKYFNFRFRFRRRNCFIQYSILFLS